MTISRDLPQFRHENVLIIATGTEAAHVLLVSDGRITELDSFKINKPYYSDSEASAGSRVINLKKVAGQDFLREFSQRLKRILSEITISRIILFTPKHLKRRVFGVLPSAFRHKVSGEIIGNFADSHPFLLLAKIADRENGARHKKPIPMRAQKLLSRDPHPKREHRHWKKKAVQGLI